MLLCKPFGVSSIAVDANASGWAVQLRTTVAVARHILSLEFVDVPKQAYLGLQQSTYWGGGGGKAVSSPSSTNNAAPYQYRRHSRSQQSSRQRDAYLESIVEATALATGERRDRF
jgi:hypothetical protein